MLLSSLCLLASLNACDGLPTDPYASGWERTGGAPSFAGVSIVADGAAGAPAVLGMGVSEAELEVGETLQLTAVDGEGGELLAKWVTDNGEVAQVTPTGLVTGMAAGTATVTAYQKYGRSSLLVRVGADGSVSGPGGEPGSQPPGSEPGSGSPSTPPGATPAVCTDYPHSRLVRVATGAELTSALDGAQPGDLILLENGTYTGRWKLRQSGSSANPIVLCGERGAVLQDTRYDGGAVLLLSGVSHWVLHGFTVRTALWGVRLERSSDNRIIGLELHDIGQEAIGIKDHSSRNVVQGNRIYDTGRRGPNYRQWGEGIYVGTYSGQWENGQVDRSDYNQLLDNHIGPNVTAEHIDVKEGTTGTIIRGNTFDGRGMESSGAQVDSWVLVQGNDGLIENNSGTYSRTNGFRVWPGHDGNWGQRNTFRNNHADLRASGYGFVIQGKDNVISCANTVVNAASGFANVPCR